MVIETGGPEETEAVGARLAADLKGGDIVLLVGELGTGKTTLVRGACRALGVDGPVTSPTFAIGSRYSASRGLEVAHLDLYRLPAPEPDLLEDYLGDGRVAFIEWPHEGEIDDVRLRVELEHLGGERRRIEVIG